jgi:hypothetical protein
MNGFPKKSAKAVLKNPRKIVFLIGLPRITSKWCCEVEQLRDRK